MHEDVRRRVEKLLLQAQSVAGTPEAEAFTDKAMALIAEYGITEIEYRMGSTNDPREILYESVTFVGNMAPGLAQVMFAIARALHCETLPLTDGFRMISAVASNR